eukprot:scaffold102384_cov54-Attheya_sp.AAC.1
MTKRKGVTSASASTSVSASASTLPKDAAAAAAVATEHAVVPKKKAKKTVQTKKNNNNNDDKTTTAVSSSSTTTDNNTMDKKLVFEPMSLADISKQIGTIMIDKVPSTNTFPNENDSDENIRAWANQLKSALEELNLLLCCVSAATYRWGSDRSGIASQNLGVLGAELQTSQEQMDAMVTPRLTNVLAPTVDLVVQKTIIDGEADETNTTGSSGSSGSTRTHLFSRELVDVNFVKLCQTILCRNAPMLRQVVLSHCHKIQRCIADYLKATHKDNQQDRSGFAY